MAAEGYPDSVRSGDPDSGLEGAARLPGKLFHAGTRLAADGRVLTAGGRVLCAVGLGSSVALAQAQAYGLVRSVDFSGAQYRGDIGYRAIAREIAS
jgi:phosphoribosylamine--glycine ligase